MNTRYCPKKAPNGDWHKADIVAALRKAGWSLRQLSVKHKYKQQTSLGTALSRSWPKAERLIAEAIRSGGEYPDIQPKHIWPSRYSNKSKSTRRRKVVHVKSASGDKHGTC
ncbi:MAG TPA: transcriptional regulator [Gammaproteobacteria bacterium]|nr:transcriptional regulator [Gammaproteobacteria bacterium]